ncbi:hypothetical protein LZC95_04465 [Pendulispora brunnea]|uniref:Uncharacterized protein n=1 Tax=Pendulispora brunnea TaxID=2905690 RepID=A0ABZ2KBM1_9BACT
MIRRRFIPTCVVLVMIPSLVSTVHVRRAQASDPCEDSCSRHPAFGCNNQEEHEHCIDNCRESYSRSGTRATEDDPAIHTDASDESLSP